MTSRVEIGRRVEQRAAGRELKSQGSYQVEMSDEGMMTEDIEECLHVVINAVAKSDLPAADVSAWCAEITRQDRVGFVCDGELATLAKKVKRHLGCDASVPVATADLAAYCGHYHIF